MSLVGMLVIILGAITIVGLLGALIVLGIVIILNRHNEITINRHKEDPSKTPGILSPNFPTNPSNLKLDPATRAALLELIEKNQMLNAIHLYREATGASVIDAKAAVEDLRDRR
jgi:hypothetical protein